MSVKNNFGGKRWPNNLLLQKKVIYRFVLLTALHGNSSEKKYNVKNSFVSREWPNALFFNINLISSLYLLL